MKRGFFALAVVAAVAGALSISCDFFDIADETRIVVRNDAPVTQQNLAFITHTITVIDIKDDRGRPVAYTSNLNIGRGGTRTFSVSEGTYWVKIYVQSKVSGVNVGAEATYNTGREYLANGDTLTCVFDGNGIDWE